MKATHFYETICLNTFNNVTAAGINNLFVGLYATSPGDSGTAGIEIQYDGYVRQKIEFDAPYEDGGGLAITNSNDLLWAAPSNNVGQARFVGISDSSVFGSGNMLLYGELTIPLEIREGQQPNFYIGDATYFFLGCYTKEFKTRCLNILRGQNMQGFSSHMALFDGDPENGGSELSGPTYARPNVTFNSPAVQVAGFSEITNTNEVRFPRPSTIWGNKAYCGIMNQVIGGQAMTKADFPYPEVLQPGYIPSVGAGDIKLNLN